MAMPRPKGKALQIAEETVPGLRAQKRNKAGKMPYRAKADVETIKIDINRNGGKLPQKYR